MKGKFLVLFILFTCTSFAQLPDTDIWLVDCSWDKGIRTLTNPRNITDRPGYDNQPAFSPDGKYILYTSVRDKKSDIYKYDIGSQATSQFTYTPNTAEYSPTFMPKGKGISIVMVESDDSTQRIWRYPMKGGDKPSVLFSQFDSIGYHCWFYGNRAGIFMLTEPASLQLIDKNHKRPLFIADSVGRCISYYNGMLYYTRKKNDSLNELYSFNLPGWHSQYTGITIEREDYVLHDDKIIFGKGSMICQGDMYDTANPPFGIRDLSEFGIKNISRIAISEDGSHLAIVSESTR